MKDDPDLEPQLYLINVAIKCLKHLVKQPFSHCSDEGTEIKVEPELGWGAVYVSVSDQQDIRPKP